MEDRRRDNDRRRVRRLTREQKEAVWRGTEVNARANSPGEHDHWFEFDGNRYHFPSQAQAEAALATMLAEEADES